MKFAMKLSFFYSIAIRVEWGLLEIRWGARVIRVHTQLFFAWKRAVLRGVDVRRAKTHKNLLFRA